MTLYGVPKKDIEPHRYINLSTFAFELDDCLYFTDRNTALGFSDEIIAWDSIN